MELLVTLRRTKFANNFAGVCDGFIVGSYFSSGFTYSLDDLKQINKYCKANQLKLYILLNNFISEEDKDLLIEYMDFLNELEVDGIYFHDLGVYPIAQSYGMTNKLIYDGATVLCNSMEVAYYMSKGISGVKISNELTLQEIKGILMNNPKACDMQLFGHLRMSYSKRKFLSNYFKQINMIYDCKNREDLYLIEEKRDYKMPIMEDDAGIKIYTDYIFEMYKELPELRPYLNRGIVDTMFIKDELILQVLRDYKRITNENYNFLKESLNTNFPDNYSSAYLYEKTNITKDE